MGGMTASITTFAVLLTLASLALLFPIIEARPHDQGGALSLIRMVGSNVREARRNLRLAASIQKELLQAVRGLGREGGRALQRRVRELVLEEEVKKPVVSAPRKRRPFAPWAGK